MGNLVMRHEVWVFFISVVLVNALFVWGIAAGILPQGLYGYGRFLLLGGTLVAVVLVARGASGVAGLLRPLGKWRIDPRWYLFGVVWAVLSCVAVLLIMVPFGGEGLSVGKIGLGPLGRPAVVRMLVIGSLIGEVVWIGYALNRLAPSLGFFLASQVVGVVWALWWAPMVLLGYGVIPGLPLAALLINQMGVAAVCALVYARTGSGLAVLVAQLSFNSAIIIFPVTPTAGGVATYWVFAVFYWVTALGLHLLLGQRPLVARRRGGAGS
jgi:hypothetical protein